MSKKETIESALPVWEESLNALFDGDIPKKRKWKDLDEIVSVLHHISSYKDNDNHTFLPTGGGLDLIGAKRASEDNCIELSLQGVAFIVRPKKLVFRSFEGNLDWSYFRLVTQYLEPSGVYDEDELHEIRECVTEIAPSKYIDYKHLETDEYNGKPLPRHARMVYRVFQGSFVTFAKESGYNQISLPNFNTYNALHDKMTDKQFASIIGKICDKLNS